jgi:uncharacterized protein
MPAPTPFTFHGRQEELRRIESFLEDDGPGLTHVRGRRRIGKTEILKRTQANHPNSFYFMGRDDESNRAAMRRFAAEWDRFVDRRWLTRLRNSELTWDEIFRQVGDHAASSPAAPPFLLLLDEVQWLAQRGAGFCGLLKDHWTEWKRPGRFKLLMSGSSNRFFHRFTDGEQAILRGLRTHATIWVRPFSLTEIREYYFQDWTDEEICLVAMMVGGVPYYLEQFRHESNFIRTVNRSMFCRDTIFLEEVDAILKLETTRTGARKRVKDVLACLGPDGTTEAIIIRRTGMAQDTVHRILERLLDYGLVRERRPLGKVKKNRSGVRLYMDDFYLNLYFQVLAPLQARIRGNERGLLFPAEVLGSRAGYTIPGFSGKAFELLLLRLLEQGQDDESMRTAPLFDKLGLRSGRYRVGTYWEAGTTQIDLVVEGLDDREVRIIEAKWIARDPDASSALLDQLRRKVHRPSEPGSWRTSRHLALSRRGSTGFRREARAGGVGLIELADLF